MEKGMQYVCELRLDDQVCYFIWVANEPDHLVTNESNEVITFTTVKEAAQYAATSSGGLSAAPPVVYDLDRINAWCRAPDRSRIAYSDFLNAWNLFADVLGPLHNTKRDFATVEAASNVLYDKLFYGCNLPSITPSGAHFTPEWSTEEIEQLAELFKIGINEFRQRLRGWVAAAGSLKPRP